MNLSLGAAAAGTFLFATLTNRPRSRHPDAVMASAAMVAVWGISTLLDAVLAPPESKLLNPVMDLALAMGVGWAWWTQRESWKVGFLALLVIQGLAHVVYQTEYLVPGVLWMYVLILNVTNVGQLLCIASPGAGYVANLVGRRLRLRDHPGVHLGAEP